MPKNLTASLLGRIAVTIACRIALNTSRRFIYPFAPDLSRALGVPLTAITSLIAVNWATTLLALVFGPVADRVGYRAMMIGGMAMLAAGMLAAGVHPGLAVLVASQFLAGLGKSIFDPAVQAYVGERVPYRRRGFAVGLLETAWAGSTLLGIPLLALLIDRAGWRAAFLALGLSAVLGLVLLWRALPAEPRPPHAARTRFDYRRGLRELAGNPAAWGMVVYAFLKNVAMDNLFVVYGVWLETSFQLSLLAVGMGTAVIGAAELAGEFITAAVADRVGLKRLAVGGVGFCVATYAALPLVATSAGTALAVLFVLFCVFEMTIVTVISLNTELAPGARATMLSAYYAAAGLGRVVGALMGGPVWLAGGIAATALTSSAVSALALAALVWGLRGWKHH